MKNEQEGRSEVDSAGASPHLGRAWPSRPVRRSDCALERSELVTIPEEGRHYVAFVFGTVNAVQFIRTYQPARHD